MRAVRISDEVWAEIAKQGRFGETEDDVLRRVFNLQASTRTPPGGKPQVIGPFHGSRPGHSGDRLTSYISGNELRVSFASGPSNSWTLPPKSDKDEIRRVRNAAVEFVEKHGASLGQANAVRKTLTEAGYHLIK